MNKINIQIEDKEYSVLVAVTEEEKTIGLSNTNDLNENEGMLFDYSDELPTELQFNTIDMKYPIDIIFINDEDKVTAVITGEPGSEEIIECIADPNEKLKYVLEINANSDIKVDDEFEFNDEEISEDDIDKMYILGPDGKPQMELFGNERIISRKETKQLISKAKKANKSKLDSDYKKLGKYIFKILNKQNTQEPEYVEAPK